MDSLHQEFSQFIVTLEKRLQEVGITLADHSIDHVCFRIANEEAFHKYFELFKENSILYTRKLYRERAFCMFTLRQPFQYKEQAIPYVELSQPGGSDNYDTGFQHIELHIPQGVADLVKDASKLGDFLFTDKYGEETYLKWEDKLVVKTTAVPLVTKSLLFDNPEITLQS